MSPWPRERRGRRPIPPWPLQRPGWTGNIHEIYRCNTMYKLVSRTAVESRNYRKNHGHEYCAKFAIRVWLLSDFIPAAMSESHSSLHANLNVSKDYQEVQNTIQPSTYNGSAKHQCIAHAAASESALTEKWSKKGNMENYKAARAAGELGSMSHTPGFECDCDSMVDCMDSSVPRRD